MSYDAETANEPLTLSGYDKVVLLEREQHHWMVRDEPFNYGMPAKEYVELRDSYYKAIDKLDNIRAWAIRNARYEKPISDCAYEILSILDGGEDE